eukprot:TRINITY_DN28533_c0_g1_i1.p1 TRINITY_DN28533_c0_g1~~TRINITY_DN28533_c0_g1_i1.p1  ORF type:complete len:163 (+),score=7.90 TRINITY_DN28533_c0_g1_i1:59-490(+)
MAVDDDWVVIPSLIEEPKVYACATCGTHLCTEANIQSKEFYTTDGRGFLVESVINITNGPPETRRLRTGMHTCEDVSCVGCDVTLGWQYTDAPKGQTYKLGMCVLARIKLTQCGWGEGEGEGEGEDTNDTGSDGFHLLEAVSR